MNLHKTGDAGSIYEPRRLRLNAAASTPQWLASHWSPPTRNVWVTNHLCPHYLFGCRKQIWCIRDAVLGALVGINGLWCTREMSQGADVCKEMPFCTREISEGKNLWKFPVVFNFPHHRHKACVASPLALLTHLALSSRLTYLPAAVPSTTNLYYLQCSMYWKQGHLNL